MSNTRKHELKAGIALADITPPVGVELSGGAFGPSKAVLHPLAAKALLLEQGRAKLLLIVCDLIGFDWDYSLAIRSDISRLHGLPRDAVMFSATHTHCGPRRRCATGANPIRSTAPICTGSLCGWPAKQSRRRNPRAWAQAPSHVPAWPSTARSDLKARPMMS
jgi:hypothetical protein